MLPLFGFSHRFQQPLRYTAAMSVALLAGLGGQEILIICIAAVILFGATKVPQFMRGLGQGVREFKQAVKDDDEARPEVAKSSEPPQAA